MAQCESCGHANRGGKRFCTRCGTPIAAQGEKAPEIVSPATPQSVAEKLAAIRKATLARLANLRRGSVADAQDESLSIRGLCFASTPHWGEVTVGGRKVAFQIRDAAVECKERGERLTRGDLVAQLALTITQAEMPIGAYVVTQRTKDLDPVDWGLLTGLGEAALEVFPLSGRHVGERARIGTRVPSVFEKRSESDGI